MKKIYQSYFKNLTEEEIAIYAMLYYWEKM